jgi:hypothetical protein
MEIIIFPALSIYFRAEIFVRIFRPEIFRPKTKNPPGLRVGRIFFPLIPLTETPPATWLDAK